MMDLDLTLSTKNLETNKFDDSEIISKSINVNKMPSEQDIPVACSSIVNLPPEIFAIFCVFLPPVDLLTLTQVCRKFRGYLCASNSFSTQQIWKESRLQFMPKEDMPPPKGMNEKQYVELLMTKRGCQFCKRNESCKI